MIMGYNRDMNKCPHCQQTTRQHRAGKTVSGSQRYRCMHCGRKYTPQPKVHGYGEEMRRRALQLYVDGNNLRRIGRILGIHHRTVSLWVQTSAAHIPAAPVPAEVAVAEMDELYSFIGEKKTESTSSPS